MALQPPLHAHNLPPQVERNLLVYVSRAGEASRRVANEEALLAGEASSYSHGGPLQLHASQGR